ncbi:MAG: transglutaminase domain-containing protein [Muribaculaceae bacterium]|nr:transglutaminase domain-containing protein [Muribaculaceae bacterium]
MKVLSKSIIAIIVALISVGIATATDNSKLAKEYVKKFQRQLALPDQADYSEEFYYQNYLTSLTARDEMPWGKSVPNREFEHFVLPVRVNNENLDTARMVFYRELRDRVKSLSMEDAILEVNHWCHEKVSYRPSDARTSSPLATMRTAYGRCGEESTFLVAALRSVCIPARQVYTPRWAHTDDNHAWVEAWANGKWYFLGACEPEPVLNLGWFNESASRGMLMHTKVAGDYDGPEEVMSRTPCYTEINVTGNYAPTSRVDINVVDDFGNPMPDATVEFKLYNYAEFYTVAKKNTDDNGATYLTAGHGDLLVWVTKDELVAVKEVSWNNDHYETIALKDKSLPKIIQLDIVPPPASAVLPVVTDEQRALNDRRKAKEDSIRQAYEATMPVQAWRGNHRTIQQFLDEAQNKVMAQKLLDVISEKDLRDINLDVLRDNEVALIDTSEIYCRYVLCPRVENEWLTPYKAFLRQELEGKIKNIIQLIDWTKENIGIIDWRNPQRLRQQPMSVYRTQQTDELGRAIFFVSAARSMGWPARINEVNGKLEYYLNYSWHEVKFEESVTLKTEPSGTLKLNFVPSDTHNDLAYYTHFTLSKLVKNRPQLLTYPEDATWSKTFKDGVELEPGTYMLTTGNRQSDGSVLASITTFEIESDKECSVDLSLRGNDVKVEILGKIDTKGKYHDTNDNTIKDVFNKNGYTIVGTIRPNHEPTNHALRDIATYAKDFEDINCSIVLINHWKQPFNSTEFNNLPATTRWGTIDKDLDFIWKVADKMSIDGMTDPIFLLCDKDGNVYFIKDGYTIHLGEQLLKTIKIIEANRKN